MTTRPSLATVNYPRLVPDLLPPVYTRTEIDGVAKDCHEYVMCVIQGEVLVTADVSIITFRMVFNFLLHTYKVVCQ